MDDGSGGIAMVAARRLGRFELREQLGAGAMGRVYRAYDPEAGREVALKVLALPLAAFSDDERRALLTRFEREARLAAALDHPGVARVLDAGESEGTPWIAIELVRGETLGSWIARRRGSEGFASEAARLLADAAEAIEAAHRRGILHRDLKPANILVESETGRARVTDFGLAREIGPGSRITLTQEGQVLGTPQYMAPEQARGEMESLDAQTDVYGLGATLYEALTGRPPYEGDAAWKIALAVVRGDCPPPRARDAAVPPELDAICRCAMAREKEARYASAAELAAELRAFAGGKGARVRGRPLVPRGPSLARALKLAIQRNKTIAATIAAAVLLFVAGGALFIWRLRVERDRAEKRAEVARDALDALVYEVQDKLEQESSDRVRRVRSSLLAVALDGIERLRRLAVESEPISLTSAEAHRRVGDLASLVGDLERAREAYERALEVSRRVVAENPRSYAARGDLSESLDKVGFNRYQRGDPAGALAAAEESVALRRALAAEAPGDIGARQAVARALGDLAAARQKQNDIAGARAAFEEAVGLAREVLAAAPGRAAARAPLAGLIGGLAEARLVAGDAKGALEAFEEALAIYRAMHAADPTAPGARVLLTHALYDVGRGRREVGDTAGARAAFEEAISLGRGLVAEDPKSVAARTALAGVLSKFGSLRYDGGDLEGAAPLFEEAVAIARAIAAEGGGASNVISAADLSRFLNKLGDTRKRKGDEAGALAAFAESLAIAREIAAKDATNAIARFEVSVALERVAEMQVRKGDLAAARASIEECIAIRRDLAAKDPESGQNRRAVAVALLNLGDLREKTGDLAGSLAAYEESLALFREQRRRDPARAAGPREVAAALQRLAGIEEKLERFDDAIASLEEAIAILGPLAGGSRGTAREVAMFEAQIERARNGKRAAAFLSGKAAPAVPEDHLALGYALYERKEYVRSAGHFAEALRAPSIRGAPERGDVYNAACAASLASTEAAGRGDAGAAAAWRARALEWLADDLRATRAALAKAGPSDPARRDLLDHLEHARMRDGDLDAIRGTAEFAKLFE